MKQSVFYTVIKNDGSFAVDFGCYTVGACGYLQAAVCDFEKKEKLVSEQRVNPFSKSFGAMKSENCTFSLAKAGGAVRFMCDNKTTFFHTACKAYIELDSENGRLTADGFIAINGRQFDLAPDDCTVIFSDDYPLENRRLVLSGFTGGEAFTYSCTDVSAELLIGDKKYFVAASYEKTGAKGYGRREYESADGSQISVQPLFNDRVEISSPLGAAHRSRFICRADGFVMLGGQKLEFRDAFGIFG